MERIDNSIYRDIQTPKIMSPFELQAAAQALQQGRDQNRLSQITFAKAGREDAERNATASAYRDSYGADGTQDRNKLFQSLVSSGQGQLVPGLQKGFNESDSSAVKLGNDRLTGQKLQSEISQSQRERSAAKIGAHLNDPELTANKILADLESQVRSGELTIEQGQAMADRIPEDPAQLKPFLNQILASVMKPKDQVDLGFKEREFGQKKDEFSYRQTNDDANRGVTVRGQDIRANTAAAGRNVTIRGQNMVDNRSRQTIAQGGGKPLPAVAVKLQNEGLEAIGTFSGIDADLAGIEKQITEGRLKLGLVSNITGRARNFAGQSNEESRNLATFKAKLENMRNAVLLLNKGVQTEGDAQRAFKELFENINDEGVVKQRLAEIRALNKRAVDLQKNNIGVLRRNYGQDDLDYSKYDAQPGATNLAPGGQNQPAAIDSLLDKYK